MSISASNETLYRPGSVSDAHQVAAVNVITQQHCFRGILSDRFLNYLNIEKRAEEFNEKFQLPTHRCIVAETNSRVTGYGTFGPPRNGLAFDAELYGLYVLPEHQKKKAGTTLFQHCVRDLIRLDYCSLYVRTLEASPYRRFYTALGAKTVGRDIINLAGESYEVLIYGWESLEDLAQVSE